MNKKTQAVRGVAVAAAFMLVLGASACSSGAGTQADNADPKSHPELFAELPKSVQESGQLKVAVLGGYPPATFKDEDGQMAGYEIELGLALAKELGIEIDFQPAAFTTVLTGVQAGRYDTALSSMADLPEREKTATFVNYLKSGVAMLVPSGNPANVSDVMDTLCGLTVSATRGTLQVGLMEEFSKENCGSRQIKIPLLDSPAEAILQVQTKRADAYMADAVVAQELATQSSKNSESELDVIAFPKIQLPPAGMPVALDNKELQNVLVKAWDKIIASGQYSEILQKWNVEVLAVDKATINAGSK